eukprot:m.435429 g.435429  ORF g.435429 m.435429 type:complete len:234 (-) comp17848_c0_seq1:300-1001(-)
MTKRYYKVPIAPVEGAFGYDTGDRTSMGYWFAEFHGQETVRQLELHPRKPPVLLERGHPELCPHSLDDTCLAFKPQLEIFSAEFEDEWTKAMLIAAAEREVEAEEQNGGEAAVEGGPSGGEGGWREDESPDEPLPEVPTPSPEIPDPVATGEKKLAPHRPAPLPPNGAAESAQFAQFRQMLADATAGASVEGNACATLWSKGVSVIKSLEGTDGFDKEHFTLFLYKELLDLAK